MTRHYDAIVIGAGVSGLYALYKLRELGLSVRVFEAGSDIGGTWYWNRYPGARFDSESYTYQYSFSQELIDEWNWSEHFSAQPEIERYLHFVADKFDLKRDIECNARVATVSYDEAEKLWEIEIRNGVRARARYLICATGLLSAHQFPDYAGVEEFAGLSLHTARWPKEPIDFTGKRVGIIGTGPTAVQVIQTIAPDCEQLTVFQRTANWCTPLRNRPITPEEQQALKEKAHEIFALCKRTWAGFIHEPDPRAAMDVPKEQRLARYQELYDRGGFALWLGNYGDSFMSQDAANEVAEFLAAKIRERVTDPRIAEKLIPKHTFGTKRCPGEKNYYETFNRSNVRLVDLRETPIKTITRNGIDSRQRDTRTRRDYLCHWLSQCNRRAPANGYSRPTRPIAARTLVRRAKDQSRRSILRLSKPLGHHGSPQPGGILQYPALRRDQRRVDRRLYPLYARERLRDHDCNPRSRRRMDQALL